MPSTKVGGGLMGKSIFLFFLLIALFLASLLVPKSTQSFSSEKISNSSQEGVSVYYFFGEGCPHCAGVEPFIDEVEQRYGLGVHRFEVYSNRGHLMRLQEYFDRYDVPADKRGIPAVFTSNSYIVGDTNIIDGFENLIFDSSKAGSEQAVVVSESAGKACDADKSGGFDCLSLLTISVAALVDSVNPCSMATLFFLMAALLLLKKREKALKVGLAFTLSVFTANLLFGMGILTTIAMSSFSLVFEVTAGLIAILAGGLLVKDCFFYGMGGFVMEVPRSLRPYLKHRLSQAFLGKNSGPIAAFIAGFLVSSFEVPCTGGPYFYVLARMANEATRMQTLPILLCYNLIFVMPLVLITTLLYLGSIHLERAREWVGGNKPLISLARGLPMIAIGLVTISASRVIQALTVALNVYRMFFIPSIGILVSYIAYQTLSDQKNRNKAIKWIMTVGLIVAIIGATITEAQTFQMSFDYQDNIRLSKTVSTSGGTVECGSQPTDGCEVTHNTTFVLGVYNLPSGISINANNVTLDCNGSTLNGSNILGSHGILLNNSSVTVKNCIVKNYYNGVYKVKSSNHNVLLDNDINSNLVGIGLRLDVSGNTISNNNVSSNLYGVEWWGGGSDLNLDMTNNTISDNRIFNNSYGIGLWNSYKNTLTGNLLNNSIVNIRIEHCGLYGICDGKEEYYDNSIDTSNTANGIPVRYYYKNCDNLRIENERLSHLTIASCKNVTIMNTTLTDGDGVQLGFVADSKVTFNDFSNNYYGIILYISSNNFLEGNKLCHNLWYDIKQYSGSGNSGRNNTCLKAGFWNDSDSVGCRFTCLTTPFVFWGDLHGHTGYSDGIGTPYEYYSFAKDYSKLDFCALTDHAEQINSTEWEDIRNQATAFLENGSFVSFSGFEWSPDMYGYGHKPCYFPSDNVPSVCSAEETNCDTPEELYQFLADNDGLSHVAHPVNRTNWDHFNGTYELNAEMYAEFEYEWKYGYNGSINYALQSGLKFGFVGVSDTHSLEPGTGYLTACRADNLTREDILDSLRNRRCYVTSGVRILLDFTVNGRPMGSEFAHPINTNVTLDVVVNGTTNITTVEFIKNGISIGTKSDCGVNCTYSLNTTITEDSYIYARVNQKGRYAWSTPIWITAGVFAGDINRDSVVDIYDAILLANAYNTRPSDTNWNVAADINNDNVVDIYDAILLANNYGKTA